VDDGVPLAVGEAIGDGLGAVRGAVYDRCDLSRDRKQVEPAKVRHVLLCRSGGSFGFAGGLVVAGGVEGQLAEEFAGGGVDDADVEVFDDEQDGVPS
jgi:hypothetical protein